MARFFQKTVIFFIIFSVVFSPFLNFKKVEAAITGYPAPHVFSGLSITASNGQFYPLAHAVWVATNSTEATVQKYMTYAGTWSGLSVYVRGANATGSTTLTVRKNGVDTGLTVTIPQSSTGFFQDLSNTVHVDAGDLMSIGVTTASGGTAILSSITTLFESDSGDTVHYNMTYDPGLAASGAQPRYYKPNGDFSGSFTSEANNRTIVQHAGQIREVSAYLISNTRTANAFFRTRINGANGNLAATLPPSGAGLYTHTGTSDSVSAGDFIGYVLSWASGSGTVTFENIQMTIVSTNPREITLMSGNQVNRNTTNTNDSWLFAGGYPAWTGATENYVRLYPITPGAMSGLAWYASANSSTQTLTFQMRKNAANGNGTLVYPASPTTGWQQDTTNSDTFDDNDYSSLRNNRAAAGSGTTTFQSTSVKYTMDTILPTYNQSAYRLFANTNTADVGSALAAQDTAGTLASAGDAFRLRMLIHVATNRLDASGQNFKLQYVGKGAGTCASPSGGTPSSYTDVTTSTLIAYKDNASPSDGAALTSNANDPTDGAHTVVNQTYEEANNFTNSQAAILSGQDGKWDFSLYDNGAASGTAYCLRAVQSDGTVLGTYTSYPQITTAASAQSITFSISDNTVGFGTLATGATRYATGDTTGTTSETVAHTLSVNTNATSGYSLTAKGATLTNGSFTITSCGASCTPTAGTEQFGLRVTASGGTGAVSSPYNHASNYAYQGSSTSSSEIAAATSGDGATTTYSVRYVGNIASTTEAGSYSGAYTYTVTPSF